MDIAIIIFFWVANLADWYTTKRLVLDKKVAKEVNPIIAFLIDKLGNEELCCGMGRAEVGMLVLKVGMGLMFHVVGGGFLFAGILFAAAAISNKFNLLGKLIRKIKELRS